MAIIHIQIKERSVPWEETPVACCVDLVTVKAVLYEQAENTDTVLHGLPDLWAANAVAAGIAAGEGAEVRWTWEGSYQGHYTRGVSR